jgi:hypothetical protein
MTAHPRRCALFTADGRLGNQMFQAAFLESLLAPGDRLYSMGLEALLEGFVWNRFEVRNTPNMPSRRWLKRLMRNTGQLAVWLRLVDGVRQRRRIFTVDGRSYQLLGEEIERSKGLFDRFIYIHKGYFQSADHAESGSFRLKEQYLAAARAFLATLPPGPAAFVHMRRGDYKNWTVLGRSPLIGPGYFSRGMALIEKAAPGTQFVLLSDEIEAAAEALPGANLHVFRGANVYEDFGMMTLCAGGIISNSTLSWWGGRMCGRTLPVVSPEGWLTPHLGLEYPIGITGAWMTPIEP